MAEYHVLNLGAGVQSTALYLLAREPDVGFKFDLADFADTGEEPGSVYKHLDYLMSLGHPPIHVRSAGKLGDDLIHGRNSSGHRFVSIPAFTAEYHGTRCGDGPPVAAKKYGMVRRQCTTEYKVEVCERFIRRELLGLKPRQRVPKDVVMYQYFGISTDEAGRAERAKKRFARIKWAVPVYPLIDRGWSRRDCVRWLDGRLPHPVPRSACVICPYKTNREWQLLKETDPTGWARAVEIDNALRREGSVANRKLDQKLYVHRSCIPLDMVDFDTQPRDTLHPMTTGECQGLCGL